MEHRILKNLVGPFLVRENELIPVELGSFIALLFPDPEELCLKSLGE